ncbi:DUF4333 domain-containing protein [Amycolatopsis sp. YIM 10]|uniref:DUF4333 domain-containing protein n=1 Tax=Amycolatopsis sp. YIM 10 TaxID=2653857 RepID=UPI00128FE0F7|nr:DUF4333 domain-containing protein [Amycolatopsis sp. YIM 10]QFU88388.1 hypothetical protein YIM_16035 [Amycolatopsis sp. YIM 10]
MFRSTTVAFVAAACAALALTGCSASVNTGEPTIAKATLEQGVTDALHKSVGQRPDSVECPDSVKAEAGQSTRCVLTASSVRYGLTATVTSVDNGNARYQVQVDNKPMP